MGGVIVSLDDLKVMQDSHDVLRHEDVAGVNGHASHRDEQGVWRGDAKEELTEHRFINNTNNNNKSAGNCYSFESVSHPDVVSYIKH